MIFFPSFKIHIKNSKDTVSETLLAMWKNNKDTVQWLKISASLSRSDCCCREVAITGQFIGTLSGNQPELVTTVQIDVGAAADYDVSTQTRGEPMQIQLIVKQHIYSACCLLNPNIEHKLIQAWALAGKVPSLGIIDVLFIVYNVTKGDGGTSVWDYFAQTHKEGKVPCWTLGSGKTGWGVMVFCMQKHINKVK